MDIKQGMYSLLATAPKHVLRQPAYCMVVLLDTGLVQHIHPGHQVAFGNRLSLIVSFCPTWNRLFVYLQATDRNITTNWFVNDGDQVLAEDMVIAEHKGQKCFDWLYYKKKNPDVANLPQNRMWRHFLTRGAVEFREHRWKCSLKSEDILQLLPT